MYYNNKLCQQTTPKYKQGVVVAEVKAIIKVKVILNELGEGEYISLLQ